MHIRIFPPGVGSCVPAPSRENTSTFSSRDTMRRNVNGVFGEPISSSLRRYVFLNIVKMNEIGLERKVKLKLYTEAKQRASNFIKKICFLKAILFFPTCKIFKKKK